MINYIDTSVVLKWYLKDEEDTEEADLLLKDISHLSEKYIISEWVIPETIRGLVKNEWSRKEIDEAYETLMDLVRLDSIQKISVSEVIGDLKDLQVEYKLYASDAVHLATALRYKANVLWTDDKHFHKTALLTDLKKKGLRIGSIKDYANVRKKNDEK